MFIQLVYNEGKTILHIYFNLHVYWAGHIGNNVTHANYSKNRNMKILRSLTYVNIKYMRMCPYQ